MKLRAIHSPLSAIVTLLIVTVLTAESKPGADAQPANSIRLTLELRCGSRLIGTPSIRQVPLITPYGRLNIALDHISTINFNNDRETARFELSNEDTIGGVPDLSTFDLHTIVGDLSIGTENVIRADVTVLPGSKMLGPIGEPLAYYKFDGDARDAGANGFHGEAIATAPCTDRDGVKDGAMRFDGEKSFVEIPGLRADATNATIALWLRTDLAENNYGVLHWNTRDNAGGIGLNVGTKAEGDPIGSLGGSFRDSLYEAGRYPRVSTRKNVADGRWHHVAFVYDGDARLYVDGVEDARLERGASLMLKDRELRIGHLVNHPPGRYHFRGDLDDVLILDQAIDPSAIAWLAQGNRLDPKPEIPHHDSLILYFPFDEPTDRQLQDHSGNGRHGAVVGAEWTNAGKVGGAYAFDGIDDHAIVPARIAPAVTDEMTIALWARPSDLSDKQVNTMLTRNFGGGEQYGMRFAGTTMYAQISDTDFTSASQDLGSFKADRWYHVALTYSKKAGRGIVYINGEPLATSALVEQPRRPILGDMYIGTDNRRQPHTYFKGNIDEVMVWERALSETEVRDLLNAQK